ncbi:Hsp70 family protein [Dactylosporangium aurantiacum]|uniref:Hsp70 family protein n=1 Tax=Dactylosporangium aurantiacum TaxID=35754 RepID=A0A9Q9MA50_9ACTN|nr:Hsp70 family protein [Dactylosporangium aurantiacum]MDG6107165.1 Hsp70 family protein [Dactylosporangium aurantiacum]UWZ51458.1 Hsp70 family protein [Dactylosporangium aurantiacum]
MTGFRLGVDFGTSTTIAMLRRPDGRVQPLLFDGSPLLSSAVLLGPDGRLHTGRDAAHLARSAPERLEPNPKRRVDDTSVLLGDTEVGVRDLVASVLRRVATEAARVAGPVGGVTLTHPANWGTGRRAVLVEAARQAGFADVDLVAEPVAAATYLAATRGAELPAGACVVVYDLGAGTCDVTLLRRSAQGFEPVASDGLNDVGGLDVDATVVAFLEATYGTLWTSPATRRQLWDDVRSAKEMLSRASGTVVMIPALGKEVPLGREQLEGLARPVLRQTVSMTRALLTESAVPPSSVAGLFLVGGSSRIPLVATMLHEALGIVPVVAEQPELVVAEGSLYATGTPLTAAPPVSGAPASGPPTSAAAVSGPPAQQPPYGPPATQPPYGPPAPQPPYGYPQPVAAPQSPYGPAAPGSPAGGYDTGAYTTGIPASAIPDSTVAGGMRAAPMPVSATPYGPAPVSAVPGPVPGPVPRPAPPGGPAGPGWSPPPPATQRRGGAGIATAVVLVLLAVVVLGGGVGVYLLTRDNGKSGGPNGSTGSGAARQPGGPGRFQLTKLPQNVCGTLDTGAINGTYEELASDPTPSRNLNTFAGTASCTVTRMHRSGSTVATASVVSVATVYADLASGAAVAKQLLDSAKLNGPVTELPGVGEQAFTYVDKQQPAVLTVTFVGVESNLVLNITLVASPGGTGKSFTDAQIKDLQTRLADIGKASLPKTVSALG